MVNRPQRTSGFSTAEFMIVLAIIGIVVMILPRIFIQSVQFYQLHNGKIEIQRDARLCMDTVNRFLRESQASTVVVDSAANQPPYSRISFTTESNVPMSFYQRGNQFLMTRGTQTSVLSTNLKYLAFTYPRTYNTSILAVAVTMEKATYQGNKKALEL